MFSLLFRVGIWPSFDVCTSSVIPSIEGVFSLLSLVDVGGCSKTPPSPGNTDSPVVGGCVTSPVGGCSKTPPPLLGGLTESGIYCSPFEVPYLHIFL